MSLLIDTLNGVERERFPVWFMRQAGRYLPEYRAVRERAGDFLTLCKTPELASEVTCQPVEILGVDAAIIFSDILVIPEALGLNLTFKEGEGPRFTDPLTEKSQLQDYRAEESLKYVYDAIRLSRQRLPEDIPLIGFTGSPWTLLAYMVEGKGSKDFAKAKKFLWSHPQEAKDILELLTEKVIEHLKNQVKAGAEVVQVFDSWGGELDENDFKEFSWNALHAIASELEKEGIPTIVFSKGCSGRWPLMKSLPCRALSVDWQSTLADVREIVGPSRVLQGNLDPISLCGSKESMQEKLRHILLSHGGDSPLIINLGHGITPSAQVETVKSFVRSAQEFSQELRSGSLV